MEDNIAGKIEAQEIPTWQKDVSKCLGLGENASIDEITDELNRRRGTKGSGLAEHLENRAA